MDASANRLRMPALGEEFRRAREGRGLTISDVAERLHIRSVYLAAIEDEDWAAIGAPVYIRGFMRTYARFLGLDPEAMVARLSETTTTSGARQPTGTAAAEDSGQRGGGPSVAAVVLILVAVILVGFVGYEYVQYRSEGPVPVAAASSAASPEAEVTTEPSAEAAAAVEPTPAAIPVATPAPALAIRLTQTSWLRVVIDGKLALEGTYPPGTAKSFSGRAAIVRVGNAGGVQIAVGGRAVGPLGGNGDVVERRFVLSGE